MKNRDQLAIRTFIMSTNSSDKINKRVNTRNNESGKNHGQKFNIKHTHHFARAEKWGEEGFRRNARRILNKEYGIFRTVKLNCLGMSTGSTDSSKSQTGSLIVTSLDVFLSKRSNLPEGTP